MTKVVNDAAKRKAKLRIDYFAILPDNLKERERILQAEEKNQRKYRGFRKVTLQK